MDKIKSPSVTSLRSQCHSEVTLEWTVKSQWSPGNKWGLRTSPVEVYGRSGLGAVSTETGHSLSMCCLASWENSTAACAVPNSSGTVLLLVGVSERLNLPTVVEYLNSMKLVIPLHSLYWSIHTKDESKRGTRNHICFRLWCELTLALWCYSIIWNLFSWDKM